MKAHIDPTTETFRAFREMQREGPIHMPNLVKYRDKAVIANAGTGPLS